MKDDFDNMLMNATDDDDGRRTATGAQAMA